MTLIPAYDDAAAPAARKPFHRRPGLQLILLLGWVLLWCLAQTAFQARGVGPKGQVGAFLGGSLALWGAFALVDRERVWNLLTSVHFAIVQMSLMAASVILGTLVLQDARPQEYLDLYQGRGWGRAALFLVRHAHAGALYSSLWFYGILLVLSLSTLAVAVKKGPYRLPRYGFLLVHVAPTLILVGGLWGKFYAVRAYNELHVGQPAGEFYKVKGGQIFEEPVPLPGFQVRLEDFRVEKYDPEFKLYAYVQPDGKGGFERNPKVYEVKPGLKGRLPLSWRTFQVEKLIPNAVANGQLVENPAAEENPVLMARLDLEGRHTEPAPFFARSPRLWKRETPGGRFAVVYQEQWTPQLLASLKPHGPKAEKLVMTFMGRTLEHEAKEGAAWDFPMFSLKVVKLYPDFEVRKDAEGNPVAATRSAQPRDPWLEVHMSSRTPEGQPGPERRLILSARNPGASDQLNAPNLPEGVELRYVREGEETQSRFVVFTDADRKVRLVEDGRVARTADLVSETAFPVVDGIAVTPVALIRRAEYVPDFAPSPTDADKFENPVMKVKVTDPDTGKSESRWLEAKGPEGQPTAQTFLDGKVGLIYQPKGVEPKDFRSLLVVTDPQGKELARKTISVNDPLIFRGYWFYQTNYRPDDPTLSGIMAVHEPGLPVIYAGFLSLLIGSLWMFYLQPWLLKRQVAKGTR